METVICRHKEYIESTPLLPHIETGTCKICGQRVQYDNSSPQAVVTVTQLGRIAGKVVIPNPKHQLLLSAEDEHDLDEAKAEAAVPRAPRALKPKKRKLLHKYYEENREAILRDYYSMRLLDFFKTWQMPSNTWTKLKKDWKVKPKERGSAKKAPAAAPIKPNDFRAVLAVLPAFPEFNDSWSELVKVHWLDAYCVLVGLIKE